MQESAQALVVHDHDYIVPPPDDRCLTCDEKMEQGKPFLRIMAISTEAAPAGVVADECEECARRHGRGDIFDNSEEYAEWLADHAEDEDDDEG